MFSKNAPSHWSEKPMDAQIGSTVRLGPLQVQQKMRAVRLGGTKVVFRPVPDRWVLPGGRECDTHELYEIASRNSWELG